MKPKHSNPRECLYNFCIGQGVKKYRLEAGATQKKIADYLHVSQSHYSKMESGQIGWTAYQVMRLCALFTVTPRDLDSSFWKR